MANEVLEMDDSELQITLPINTAVAVTTPASLLQIAVQRGASIDELTALMNLQDRHEATQARKAYVVAMAEFKRHAPTIHKDKAVGYTSKEGVFTGYSHASLGNICGLVIEEMAKHGLNHRWDTKQPASGLIIVTCIITHSLGHSEETTLEAPPDNSGKKNAIQQMASAVSYLQRYTLLAACGLATNDMPDDDGRSAGEVKQKEVVKSSIGGKAFDKAVAAIKAGEYTAAEIRQYYTLTTDQETVLSDIGGQHG